MSGGYALYRMNTNCTQPTSQQAEIVNPPCATYVPDEAEIEAAMEDIAPLMSKICKLVEKHPEWRTQSGPNRVNSILRELRKL